MQPMRLCIFPYKPFEDTFENTQWRKVNKKTCALAFSRADNFKTFEIKQWKRAKQMRLV